MFRSLRWKLIASYVALTVLPLLLLGLFLLQALDRFYLDRLQEDLNTEAGLIAQAVGEDMQDGRLVDAEQLLNNPPPPLKTQARGLLFDQHGLLFAATDASDRVYLGHPRATPA